jgi:hypothetical protein
MHQVPIDPALPALRELFPPGGAPEIVARFAEDAFGEVVDARAGGVSYVRYRPTRGCDVLWSFPRADGRQLWVAGKASADVSRFAATPSFQRSADIVSDALGKGRSAFRVLPEQQVLLQMFPLDARLPGLALATSPSWSCEPFREWMGLGADEVRVTDILALHYKPWRRCVLRYTVDDGRQSARYFAKVFRDHRGEPMVERLRDLRRQLIASGAAWDVAVPVMYIPEARMLVLEELENSEELSPLLRKAIRDEEARATLRAHIVRIAEGLIAFQTLVVDGLPAVEPRDVLTEYAVEFEGIHAIAGGLAAAIEVQLATLEAVANRLRREAVVISHGAFRYNQFLCRGDSLIALDLDALRLSGIGADAGEFLAYFDLVALRRPHLRPIVEECQDVFLAAVMQQPQLDPRWLAWHRAASLIKWTHRTFLSLDRRWPDVTDGLVRLAQATLESPACAGARHRC